MAAGKRISELPRAVAVNNDALFEVSQGGQSLAATATQIGSVPSGGVSNARWFGAKGNGTADDYPPIQAAINYVQGQGGGTVLIPGPGTYSLMTGELLVTVDKVAIIIGQGAVLEQATYGWSTIQLRNCDGCSVLGPGMIRNPVTKTQITGPLYDNQPARGRSSGVYVYDCNYTTIGGGLQLYNMVTGINIRPGDPTVNRNTNNKVDDIRSTHHDFGLLPQAQRNLILTNIQGDITDFTQVTAPPHLIYVTYTTNEADLKSENLSITNIVDYDNQFSSSIKVKHSTGVYMDGLQSLNCARGYDINCDEFVMVGPQAHGLVYIGDSQQGGIQVTACTTGIILEPIITLSVNDDLMEAIVIRVDTTDVVVKGGRLTASRSVSNASAQLRMSGTRNKCVDTEFFELGVNKYPISIEDSTGCSVITPFVRQATSGNRIVQIEAGAIGSRVELDLARLNFVESNASVNNLNNGTQFSYIGQLPTRAIATLPFAYNYTRSQFFLTDGISGQPMVVSDGLAWRYPSGVVAISNAADAWAAAVVANGGTVSPARLALIRTYIAALETAGTWAITDDFWMLVAENEPQALTSLKQLRLATAVAAPAFTIDRGYALNGTTQYINTGFIPSSHAVALSATNMRLAVYERTNVIGTSFAAGTLDTSTRNMQLQPRYTGGFIRFGLNSTITAGIVVGADSRGFTAVSRAAGPVFTAYKNGAVVETIAPANATSIPTRALYIGALNNAGTAANFRASTLGFVSTGAALTAGQETPDYNALQTFMTAVGANV